MSSVSKKTLVDVAALAGTASSQPVSMELFQKNFILYLKITNRTAGTYNIKFQHSPDKINWFDNGSFSSASANTSEVIVPTAGDLLLPFVRVSATVTSGPGDADILVELLYDRER